MLFKNNPHQNLLNLPSFFVNQMVLATALTLIRVLALPAIIYLILQQNASAWALAIFSATIIANFLDRRQEKKANFKVGSFLDPFADKILVMGLLLFFAWEDRFSWLVLVFFMVADLLSATIRWTASRDDLLFKEKAYQRIVVHSQQGIVCGLILDNLISPEMASSIVLLFTLAGVVFAVVSVFYYFLVYGKNIRVLWKLGKEVKEEKMVILANKKSGGYQDRYRRHLLHVFSRRRMTPILYLPKRENMYLDIEKATKDAEQVIIAGGDGSFESALNYRPFWKKSLGFFPLGKGNAFYSYFYRGKRFEYLRSRFKFKEADLDVVELEWDHGKVQTEFLSVGLDAEIARLSQDRKHNGFYAYFKACLKGITKAQASFDLDLKIDRKKISWENCITLTLGKVPFFGFGMRSLFHAEPDDGKIYGVGHVNKHSALFNKALRLWSILLLNMGMVRPPMVEIKGKLIEVKSEVPFPLQAGGEFLGFTQWVRVRVVRKQKVLVI